MQTSKSNDIKIWITCLVIGAGVFLLSNLGVFVQLQGWGLAITSGLLSPIVHIVEQVEDGADFLSNLVDIHSRNLELEEMLSAQRVQLSELEPLSAENSWLKEQLGIYEGVFNPPQILAHVVRYQYTPVAGYLFVYTPKAVIAVGDFVVESANIVGEVVEVMGYYAKIRLITSVDSDLPIQVSKQVGRLVGDSAVSARIEGVNNTVTIPEGTPVYLFNPENPAAARFPLGKTGAKLSTPADATQEIKLEIPGNLANLEFLIVLNNDSN